MPDDRKRGLTQQERRMQDRQRDGLPFADRIDKELGAVPMPMSRSQRDGRSKAFENLQ